VKTEAPLLPCFALEETFFGFKPEDRVNLHSNIFDLIWAGEGRWDWQTVYNMPIFLRTFYIKKINSLYEKALKQQKKELNKSKSNKQIIKGPL